MGFPCPAFWRPAELRARLREHPYAPRRTRSPEGASEPEVGAEARIEQPGHLMDFRLSSLGCHFLFGPLSSWILAAFWVSLLGLKPCSGGVESLVWFFRLGFKHLTRISSLRKSPSQCFRELFPNNRVKPPTQTPPVSCFWERAPCG